MVDVTVHYSHSFWAIAREIDLWCFIYFSWWSRKKSKKRARESKIIGKLSENIFVKIPPDERKHFRVRDRSVWGAVKSREWKHDCEVFSSCIYTNWYSPFPPVEMATSTQSNRRPQQRYTRSSTASVTQLLSDSCNSLLQRFRRPPSEKLTGDKTFSLATNR